MGLAGSAETLRTQAPEMPAEAPVPAEDARTASIRTVATPKEGFSKSSEAGCEANGARFKATFGQTETKRYS